MDVDPADLEEPARLSTETVVDEDRERLALMLPRLPEKDRALLLLSLKGHSFAEIAKEVGLGYDAARIALSRAVRRAHRST